MPELARFYGIVVRMYYSDHSPPHFHAYYGSFEAVIAVHDLSVVAGALPARAMGLVAEWAQLHRAEISAAWERASSNEPPGKIDPLP